MAALEVADIFRRHGEAYRQTHAGHLGRTERRIMGAIEACRTVALGGHIERCADCGLIRIAYNSCRNRHCPKCQGPARAAWLAERQAELLPVPYFHVVFTLPPAAAEIAFQNKATVYAILFKAAAETLNTIAADPRHLGAEIGFVAVLHTWGQNLQHHPHVVDFRKILGREHNVRGARILLKVFARFGTGYRDDADSRTLALGHGPGDGELGERGVLRRAMASSAEHSLWFFSILTL